MSSTVVAPAAGLWAPLAGVVRASWRALATMVALIAGVALVAGLLVGDLATPLAAAAWAIAITWSSMALHEWGHVLVHRLGGHAHRGEGIVCGEWSGVWVSLPATGPVHSRLTAASGPLLGAALCAGWFVVGAPGWIAAAVALVHLGNLVPAFPDGRILFRGP